MEIILFTVIGFVLILVDLILVPGLVILAIGSCMVFYSIWLNYQENGLLWASLHLLACLSVVPKMITYSLNRVALKKELKKEDGYVGVADQSSWIGKKGVVETDLRPSGTVRIKDDQGKVSILDCISEGPFMDEGTEIKVVEQRGPSLVVREVVEKVIQS